MSLRVKTIFGVALIEALLLILLVSMTLNYLKTTNYSSLAKRATTTAELFSTTTKDAILSYDLASLESFVSEVLKNPDLSYARVLGPNGEIFASGGDPKGLNKTFKDDKNVEMIDDGIFDTHSVIEEGGVVYGQVEIGIDITGILNTIEEAEQRSIFIAGIEMLLVALFSFALGTYLTKQLKVLMKATKSIADGTLDINIPVSGKDELAAVSSAFNLMAKNLHEASEKRDLIEAELKDFNQKLEEIVQKRTKIIIDKNQQLETANKNIKDTQTKLMQSEKMASVGLLAAGVAHEINNPMSFIISNVDILEEYSEQFLSLIMLYKQISLDSTNKEALLKQIEAFENEIDLDFIEQDLPSLIKDTKEGTSRVKEIVQGLKDFSHADQESSHSYSDLNDCINSTLKVANNELKYHCDIQTNLEELPKTYCAPGQIKQVILNLLINAGHAIKEKGTIEINSQFSNGQITVSIKDDGCGIPEDKIDKLFDPFYTTKPLGKGTGLGLAISYGIIQDHKGKIDIESKQGVGSTFTISLPVIKEKSQVSANSEA
ncbi:histidine kinase [Marinomonas sp. SBI22]|uniref:ATP-binding protein n=1 Tax=unclassified Marinomonas TaxID=196814 RepID=UPI0007AF7A28|nr:MULTISPECIES: ATP-binding protein [unclassified Marinomonas]KZM44192.1 histidine kinase [Marinomonas sp. SBI22]KZM45351.1 histidine kinase [Marinomonas sp. SBI8L]